MLSVALRPKYLGILAVMVLATIVCGLLANWQWNRATESMETTRATETADSVPLDTVLGVGDPVTNDIQGRLVSAVGHFEVSKQAVSPDRKIDGTDAAVVVTNFHITEGELAGVNAPVARGWVADTPEALADIPSAPQGDIRLVARLEAAEGATGAVVEKGASTHPVISTISSPYLVNVWGAPMLTSYLAITEPAIAEMNNEPPGDDAAWATALNALPAAESQFSSGLNLQNFGYMLQWIIFGLFFLYIWWRTVRTQYLEEKRERLEQLEEHAKAARADVE